MKAIIYDFDGVIADSVNIKTEAFRTMYLSYGNDIAEKVVKYHLLNGGISRFEKIKHFHKELLNIELSKEQISELSENFSRLVKQKVFESEYISGALEFLQENKENLFQFICTGTPQDEIEEILNFKKISYLFDGVYGSPTTKIDIIKKILNSHSLKKEDVVMFGDALTDYNAARATDIKFIGVSDIVSNDFPKATKIIPHFNYFKINDN